MGSYNCSYSSHPAEILDDFWAKLPIRNTSVEEYVNFVDDIRQTPKITLDELHLNLSKRFFVHPVYIIESQEIFDYILLHFGKELTRVVIGNEEANQNYSLFLISMIFLCKPDVEAAYACCLRLIKAFNVPLKGDLISKKLLKKILRIFVTIITIIPVTYLKSYSDNPGQFESELNEIFNSKIIDVYVKNLLLSHISSNTIRIYKFFCRDYIQLTDDAEVRYELYELGRDQSEVNQRRSTYKKNSYGIQPEIRSLSLPKKDGNLLY